MIDFRLLVFIEYNHALFKEYLLYISIRHLGDFHEFLKVDRRCVPML